MKGRPKEGFKCLQAEMSDILNLLKYAPKNPEDIGTVRKLRPGEISICFCSENHPPTLCFIKHAEKKMWKIFCKVCATPIAFIVIQLREGIQYSGQFVTLVGPWE